MGKRKSVHDDVSWNEINFGVRNRFEFLGRPNENWRFLATIDTFGD